MLEVAEGVRVGAEVDGQIVGLIVLGLIKVVAEGFEEEEMKLGGIHGLKDGR